MIASPTNASRIAVLGFCLALLLGWACYWPATGGDFQLDDRSNLGGLVYVDDAGSAWDFILSGTAGPSGRPLALATFAAQADRYADGASAFVAGNILIHLVNAVVLALCLYQVALLSTVDRHKAVVIAAIATSSWLLLPLLATASLLVVQRMATLSATFVLLGLAGYLLARRRIDAAPRQALTGMTVSLLSGTVLATLTKESGLLLPVFVLVLELTILAPPATLAARQWRGWQVVFLFVPCVLLLGYLARYSVYPEGLIVREGYNGWERLLTQARLLWLYLFKTVLGLPAQLGIYQDVPAPSRSFFEPLTMLASLAWLVLVAFSIAWRRRFPLAALAVLWYLAGHLIESTVLPLELYFEHRNYLAIAGPLFALASAVALAGANLQKAAAGIAAIWLCANAFFLYTFASLWGEPSAASRYWAMQYPDSVRAVTNMASYQLAEEGPLRTLQTLDRFVIDHPQHAYLRIQELNLLCQVAADQDHGQVIERLRNELPAAAFTLTAGTMLSELFSTITRSECASVDAATVKSLANQLRSNPVYARLGHYGQFHHKLLAAIERYQGDYAATIDNLQRAMAYGRSSELNMMMVTALGGAGDFDAANEFIEDAYNRLPANPIRAAQWRRDLDGLQAYIRELENNTLEKE